MLLDAITGIKGQMIKFEYGLYGTKFKYNDLTFCLRKDRPIKKSNINILGKKKKKKKRRKEREEKKGKNNFFPCFVKFVLHILFK